MCRGDFLNTLQCHILSGGKNLIHLGGAAQLVRNAQGGGTHLFIQRGEGVGGGVFVLFGFFSSGFREDRFLGGRFLSRGGFLSRRISRYSLFSVHGGLSLSRYSATLFGALRRGRRHSGLCGRVSSGRSFGEQFNNLFRHTPIKASRVRKQCGRSPKLHIRCEFGSQTAKSGASLINSCV